jgi:hypothetical protein
MLKGHRSQPKSSHWPNLEILNIRREMPILLNDSTMYRKRIYEKGK